MKKTLLFYSLFISAFIFAESPYIYRVWEYRPAPGQFVNLLPEYEKGDDSNMMRVKAEEQIADNNRGMITLGGWGGYVTFGFDHLVPNVSGERDFIILGNAFYSQTDSDNQPSGGSSEPGVVMVSYDQNGNGKPDDEWYELAGSEHNNPLTKKHYSLSYHRPADDKQPTPSKLNPALTDTTYIKWTDNENQTGYMNHLTYNQQPYFPQWLDSDILQFEGTRLPDNYIDKSGNGTYYVLQCFDYGYADNHPNTAQEATLDIDWAVDSEGNAVHLKGIHFVRVYTGVHQQCGWIGETSTEIMGAEDLHFTTALHNNALQYSKEYFTLTGQSLGTERPTTVGVYIMREGSYTRKVLIK